MSTLAAAGRATYYGVAERWGPLGRGPAQKRGTQTSLCWCCCRAGVLARCYGLRCGCSVLYGMRRRCSVWCAVCGLWSTACTNN